MKKINIMIGLPRCGKSTWLLDHKTSEVVVSADELRLIIYKERYNALKDRSMWMVRTAMLKALMGQGIDIIIDETSITKSARRSVIKLAKENGYYVVGTFIESNVDECIKRAELTGQLDLIEPIKDMNTKFQIPELKEGFDELNVIPMDTPVVI